MSAPGPALIVDDCRGLALHLQYQLRALGLRAEIAAGQDEALARCGDAAVVFVELQQARGNGFELVRLLGARGAGALVLLSGTGRGTDLPWGLRAGANAVLKRPLRQQQLRECLRGLGPSWESV